MVNMQKKEVEVHQKIYGFDGCHWSDVVIIVNDFVKKNSIIDDPKLSIVSTYGYYDSVDHDVTVNGHRLETDGEQTKRIDKEQKAAVTAKETKKKNAQTIKEREQAELARLLKKYPQ